MLKKIKNYKFILISKYDATVTEYNPSRLLYAAISISFFIVLLFSLLFFSKDFNSFISLEQIKNHRENNIELHSIVKSQQNKINQLTIEVDNLSKRDDNMRSLLKLPLIDKDIRKLGVGGGNSKDKFNSIEYLLPEQYSLDGINDKIDFLIRSVNLENLSYTEIENKIFIDKEKILHYPAIHPTSLDKSKFTSGFGYRFDPFTKNRKNHEGHDFSAKVGTNVYSTANGIVKASRYLGSFGNYVEVDHGNGFITTYGHLSKRLVKKGDIIERGKIIGKVGNTGRSTASHLHYEIKYKNKKLDPSAFYFDLSL
jgi:murein DD-endopeptidase MepM/ murein hydrolase activator NlpD